MLPLWYHLIDGTYMAIEGVGLVIGIVRWRALDRSRRFLTAWLGAAFIGSIAQIPARLIWQNSQIIAQFWYAFSGALGLWTLASLSQTAKSRTVVRWLAIAYVLVWGILLASIEVVGAFAKVIGAFHAVTLMLVAGMTLIRRGTLARRGLDEDVAFLIAAGLVVFAAPTALLGLVGRWLMGVDNNAVIAYYAARLVISSCGLLLLIAALRVGAKPRNAVHSQVPATP